VDRRPASLDEVESQVWDELGRAVADRRHPWRTPVLATTADGGLPDARTVVLREADAAARRLVVYTDDRAAKVAQLRRQPVGMVVMWSPVLGWQLRCRVRLALADPGLATSARWARVRLSPSAQDYLAPFAPGTPLPAEAPTHPAVPHEHFAVIEAAVESLDWLELHRDGHRRARFDAAGRRWLQP
jgi:hypothetical protein